MILLTKYKYIPIPPELKDKFVKEVKRRKGVSGGVIMESTVEAIKLWINYPELVNENVKMHK